MNKELFLSEKKLKELFLRYGIRIKKEKGQNFLVDFNIISKLIDVIGEENKIILEIGSGPGNITIFLKEIAEKVIGVEVDKTFFPILKTLEKRYPNLSFIHKDIRKVELDDIGIPETKIKVVGNIPYYLTSFIMRKLYGWAESLEEAIIMMPKDVADRIIAIPGTKEYGILSVVTQLAFSPKILFKVKPGSFFPRPKIDSAVVKFVPHEKYSLADEDLFFRVLNLTFGERRKMISNTLKSIIPEKDEISKLLEDTGIEPKSRPEDLSVNDFVKLCEKIRYFS